MEKYSLEHVFLKLDDPLFIKEYVTTYPEIMQQQFAGETIGHRLAKENRCSLLKYLISQGYDIRQEDKNGESIIIIAIREYYFDLLEMVQQTGSLVDYTDSQGRNLLSIAYDYFDKSNSLMERNSLQGLAAYWLNIHSEQSIINAYQPCLKHSQSVALWSDLLELLTKRPAAELKKHITNFLAASIMHNNEELFNLVTENTEKAILEECLWRVHDQEGQKTPMYYAASNKDCHLANRYFSSYQFNPDQKSILHLLLTKYKVKLVMDWLQENKVASQPRSLENIVDSEGNSLLMQVIALYNEADSLQLTELYELMGLLVAIDENIVNYVNDSNRTPLHEAAIRNLELVTFLLGHSVKLDNIVSVIRYIIEKVGQEEKSKEYDAEALARYNEIIGILLISAEKNQAISETMLISLIADFAIYPDASIFYGLINLVSDISKITEQIEQSVKYLVEYGKIDQLSCLVHEGTITDYRLLTNSLPGNVLLEKKHQQVQQLSEQLNLAEIIATGDSTQPAWLEKMSIEASTQLSLVKHILEKRGVPIIENDCQDSNISKNISPHWANSSHAIFDKYIKYLESLSDDIFGTLNRGQVNELKRLQIDLAKYIKETRCSFKEKVKDLEEKIAAIMTNSDEIAGIAPAKYGQIATKNGPFIYEKSKLEVFLERAIKAEDGSFYDQLMATPENKNLESDSLARSLRDLYKLILPLPIRQAIDKFANKYPVILANSSSVEDIFRDLAGYSAKNEEPETMKQKISIILKEKNISDEETSTTEPTITGTEFYSTSEDTSMDDEQTTTSGSSSYTGLTMIEIVENTPNDTTSAETSDIFYTQTTEIEDRLATSTDCVGRVEETGSDSYSI